MSSPKKIKTEDGTSLDNQHIFSCSDDPSQPNYFMITIKKEPDLSHGNDDLLPGEDISHNETDAADEIQIKTEIIIEETKVEQYSEFEQNKLKYRYQTENVIVSNAEQEKDALDVKPNIEALELLVGRSDPNTVDETSSLEDNEIKTEITIEKTQVEQYSEFDNHRLKIKCEQCDFRCNSRRTLCNHSKVAHPENSVTRCLICFATCIGTSNLEKHIEDKHQGLGIICKICSTHYKKGQKKEHETQCPGRLLFICKTCKQQYVTREGLFRHLDEHGVQEDLKESSITELRIKEHFLSCVVCDDGKAYKRGPFKQHKERHVGCHLPSSNGDKTNSNPSEELCKTSSSPALNTETVRNRQSSLSSKNNDSVKGNIVSPQHRVSFNCNECKTTFNSEIALRYHRANQHQKPQLNSCIEKEFGENSQSKQKFTIEKSKIQENSKQGTNKKGSFCKFCDFSCGGKTSLLTHIRKAHPEDRKILCGICRTIFNGNSELTKHITEAHGGLGNECIICLAQYREDQKEDHKAECLGRLLFNCDHCKTSFLNKEQLLKHLDEHGVTEDRKESSVSETRIKQQFFSCEICGDGRAYEKSSLREHAKEQHGGHFLLCPDCRKTFDDICARKTHMKKYCRVGPARERFKSEKLECPKCFKSCQNKAALEDHMIKYHRKNPYQCTECGMKFSSGPELRQHKIKIHLDYSLSCSYCQRKFKLNSELRVHMTSHQNW